MVLVFLQTQCKRQATKTSGNAETLLCAAVLLRASTRGTSRTTCAVPASASCASAVVVLFDVGFLVAVLALLAETKNGEKSVEEGAGAAEKTQQKQQQNAQDDTNDDTGNGATAETVVLTLSGNEVVAGCASGNWSLEGNCRGWGASVGDYNNA